jgi:hypothetical protein
MSIFHNPKKRFNVTGNHKVSSHERSLFTHALRCFFTHAALRNRAARAIKCKSDLLVTQRTHRFSDRSLVKFAVKMQSALPLGKNILVIRWQGRRIRSVLKSTEPSVSEALYRKIQTARWLQRNILSLLPRLSWLCGWIGLRKLQPPDTTGI